jgi:hypothetical protein
MKVLRLALAGLLLIAFGAAAQASHIFWVDGNDSDAFENPAGAGQTPAGWTQGNLVTAPANLILTDTVANGGQVFEGDQSVKVDGTGRRVIVRPVAGFHDTGEYRWMFYDDMSGAPSDPQTPNKNVRVGLTRPADNLADPTTVNPRFAAIAVENGTTVNHSATNYVWHHAFSFGPMTTPRSLGWHEMALKWDKVNDPAIGDITRIQYLVDGVLGATRFHTAVFTPTGEYIGAPFGTLSPAWVDGITIPEPATFALAGLGLLGALFASRRQSR